jgi:hypothetical protein
VADGDLYCAWGDGGGFGGKNIWGLPPYAEARGLRWQGRQPSMPSTPSSTRWEAFARRTTARIPFTPADWAPKQHCLVGGFREILANCGAAVSIWTTGTTAVQLGASTTTIAGGQFSLTFTFTFT